MPIANIALETPLPRLFDYTTADVDAGDLGRLVRVPLGRREVTGILVGLSDTSQCPPEQLREITRVARETPGLPAELMALARLSADYYQYPYGATLLSLLPPVLKHGRSVRRPSSPQACVLTEAGRGHAANLPARAHAQRRLAERLAGGPVPSVDLGRERSILRRWLELGYVKTIPMAGGAPSAVADRPPVLNADQSRALRLIREAGPGFRVWLLFGVTGSGKTEVYLRLIESVLAQGRQALVLVPEIHLTPQLTERFQRRFPSARLVSLHSGLADGERTANWLDCLADRADIVLGTRLAVYAPLSRLGLIVADEEHDPSYKQIEGLRYSARDVAIWRGHELGVPVVLGSATPALETWHNARRGRYGRLDLPARAGQSSLPGVRLIDTRTDRPRQGLTAALIRALESCVARGEQALVFINRRGYAPTLFCNACGHVAQCPRCAAHLVLHRQAGPGYRLQCHHCGLVARTPEACPECGALDLRPSGQGTQRLEETLAERFPEARILRVDRDTVGRKGRFQAVREAVEAGDVDILVGTQILAKGHDFPRLTLVGVVGADQALMSADWRAGERLFAQLMQVAGRAGRRGEPGEVLVQTAYPNHPLYQALVAHDYVRYAELALRERRQAEFPPYTRQALLRADAHRVDAARSFLDQARAAGLPLAQGVGVFDPAPALMSRIANRERWQLLVQSRSRKALQSFLKVWVPSLYALPSRGVNWNLDVDPMDF